MALVVFACSILASAGEPPPPDWKAANAVSPDGTQVALFWTAPEGNGPFPVVIFLHGAPGGVGENGLRRLLGSSRWPRFLSAGFAVCIADYRGHAGDKPFDVLKGGIDATDDLAAVIKHLGGQPRLDVRRLAVSGQSLGGVIALEAVSRGKIAPACLVVSAPATFLFLGYRGGRGGRPDRDLSDAEIDRPAALARIEKINLPVLIVQGTGDGLCALNKKLFELMKAAGKNARLDLFEGAPHGFVNGPENDNYRRALDLMVDFISRHVAPKAAALPSGRAPPAAQRRNRPAADRSRVRKHPNGAAGRRVRSRASFTGQTTHRSQAEASSDYQSRQPLRH